MDYEPNARGARELSLLRSFQTGSRTHPASYLWETGAFSLGVKRTEREVDNPPSSSVDVKDGGVIPSLHHKPSQRGAYFIKHTDNFIFYLYNYIKISTL
jgi:hypothetical protein